MTDTENTPTGVRTEISKSAISLDKVYAANFQKPGTLSAQIRQLVTTKSYYPSKKVESDLQSGIFGLEDFGFSEQEFVSEETRMAWIPVPANAKPEEVAAKLAVAHANGATIYKVLSNEPILDENQKYGLTQVDDKGNPLVTLDSFANSQAIRFPENDETRANGTAGKLILDKVTGMPSYRRTFFWKSPMADVDLRATTKSYVSPELLAEIQGASVMQGQTV